MIPLCRRLVIALVLGHTWLGAQSPIPADSPAEGDVALLPTEETVIESRGVIDHTGGRLVTADGAVTMEWAPNPARPPTPAKIWRIIAPGGVGFQVSGPAGPGQLTCLPPGSALPPGVTDPAAPAGGAPGGSGSDGGVEILGPDQAWTTTKSTLNPDGSRTIEFIDERKPLRKKGLVKGSSGPYVIYPQRATVLRGRTVKFKVVNEKEAQKEWKDAVKSSASADDEELAPLAPTKKAVDDEELAPLAPTKPASTSASDAGTGDLDIDDLAPLAPRQPGGNRSNTTKP